MDIFKDRNERLLSALNSKVKSVEDAFDDLIKERSEEHEQGTLHEYLFLLNACLHNDDFSKIISGYKEIKNSLVDEYGKEDFTYEPYEASSYLIYHEDIPEVALRHALRLQSELTV